MRLNDLALLFFKAICFTKFIQKGVCVYKQHDILDLGDAHNIDADCLTFGVKFDASGSVCGVLDNADIALVRTLCDSNGFANPSGVATSARL